MMSQHIGRGTSNWPDNNTTIKSILNLTISMTPDYVDLDPAYGKLSKKFQKNTGRHTYLFEHFIPTLKVI